jgi:integrase
MADPTLVLRDIHATAAPSLWPPAPGWWLLAALLLAAGVALALWRRARARRRRRILQLFDEALAAAANAPAQVAAMSALLRRAARRRDRHADTLQGEAWLAFLDANDSSRPFTRGDGRLLLDGGFQRDADPARVATLGRLARARFLEWMTR